MKKKEFDSLQPGDYICFVKYDLFSYELVSMGEFKKRIYPGDVALVLETKRNGGRIEHLIYISDSNGIINQGWINPIWTGLLDSIKKVKIKK